MPTRHTGDIFPWWKISNPKRKRLSPPARQADSIAIDPHKHGLQPYGCGCILFKDPGVGRLYKHNSPYTYFTSTDLHLGEISLECSRPGAAAAALWATQKLLPLSSVGSSLQGLAKSREAALELYSDWKRRAVIVPFAPELDIVIFALRANSLTASSVFSRQIFEAAARRDLHLALAELPIHLFQTFPSEREARSQDHHLPPFGTDEAVSF